MTHASTDIGGSIFRPEVNCRAVATADYAAPLVDCVNYYKALHEAISVAQHSVFVFGWDIDGRIKLLRDGSSKTPRLFDLVCARAAANPQVQFYLNRWDYSLFMAKDREAYGSWRWRHRTPPNVHYCLDGATPTGASHHQKIILVDDEVAFCGGMDIAQDRFDSREHRPSNHVRIDQGPLDGDFHCFEPYHDTQMVMTGDIVKQFSQIARERWLRGCGAESIPIREVDNLRQLPAAWPQSVEPVFRNVRMAVSETLPRWDNVPLTEHIEQLYIDMINRAERFIYMENQFLVHKGIAHALNQRLREKPLLRVLMVSCYDPRGQMEKKAMWHGRVLFRDIIESGGVAERVTMASVFTRSKGKQAPVRMHSKLMIVDDGYLRIGSSNINNRSMYMDTECDVVIEAQNDATRESIIALRNDLIREHTGREIDDIHHIIESGQMPSEFLNYLTHSFQHLRKIDDGQYRYERFTAFARAVADPVKPIIPVGISMMLSKLHIIRLLLVVSAVAALGLAWKFTPLATYADPENVVPLLEQVRNTPWAVPVAMAVYTIGTLLFFPHMAMTATVVIVFSPLQAFSIAMTGSLLSGAIGFFAGQKLGMKSMRGLIGNAAEKISGYAKKGGLAGITLLRMLPIAPYTAVNLALGMLEVSFWVFMAATLLGTLPGTAIAAFMGHTALEAWQNPTGENLLLLGGGFAVWVGIVVASHLAGKWWRKRHNMSRDKPDASQQQEAQA